MKSARGATATGANATGTAAFGALALGAMALGAMAVGALAIGRLSVGRARLRRVEIGELVVGRLDIGPNGRQPGVLTAVARIRAAPGKGDAMARLLLDQVSFMRADEPGIFSIRRIARQAIPTCFCSTNTMLTRLRSRGTLMWPGSMPSAGASPSRNSPRAQLMMRWR